MDVDKKLENVEKQKAEIYKKRDELIQNMNPQIYRFYEKIKRWAGITAVTPIKKQACSGCNMRINDKIYSEVLKGEEIVTCPHCGRVLFIEDEDKPQE
jgi:predicted  nucleic acid-binding Zn-ribbon protein